MSGTTSTATKETRAAVRDLMARHGATEHGPGCIGQSFRIPADEDAYVEFEVRVRRGWADVAVDRICARRLTRAVSGDMPMTDLHPDAVGTSHLSGNWTHTRVPAADVVEVLERWVVLELVWQDRLRSLGEPLHPDHGRDTASASR